MSNDQEQDKTEEPTPFKLREAKKKGQVAKSQELNHWLMLTGFSFAVLALWAEFSSDIKAIVQKLITTSDSLVLDGGLMVSFLSSVTMEIINASAPALLLIIIVAILTNVIQVGGVISTHQIKPDFKRIHPKEGVKKIFGRKILFELFKTVSKIVIFICVILYGGEYFISSFYGVAYATDELLDDAFVKSVITVVLILQFSLLPIVLMDLFFSKREFMRKMKMSRREVKEEHKRNDGNPEVKSKRKEIENELREKIKSMGNVKDADVIITNPTHYAVALRYDKDGLGVPTVVAKGKGEVAKSIRATARAHSKPILRRPPLARLLYKECGLSQPIPLNSYQEVAKIYRFLSRLKSKN